MSTFSGEDHYLGIVIDFSHEFNFLFLKLTLAFTIYSI